MIEESREAELPPLHSFQVFGRYADSSKWDELGIWRVQLVPRIGDTIIADVDDWAHAFRVVGVHHPEGRRTTDLADLFVVHVGREVDERKRLFRECREQASKDPPSRQGFLAPGYRSADDGPLPF